MQGWLSAQSSSTASQLPSIECVIFRFNAFLFVVTASMRLFRQEPDESGHYERRVDASIETTDAENSA